MQAHLSCHLQGIVMPKFTIEQKVHDLEGIADLLEQPLDMCLDETQRRAQFYRATVAILEPSLAIPFSLNPHGQSTPLRWV
jgi:hypothetical protein